jgi:cobalt/nickel transport protein
MSKSVRYAILLCGLFVPATTVAHYHMLLPESASPALNRKTQFVFQWGHPFEHELFDASKPEEVFVVSPSGKRSDLSKNLESITVGAGGNKEVKAWRFSFASAGQGKDVELGDYVFAARAPKTWMADENEFWQDAVKTVLHVEAQKGWDQAAGLPFELIPLTRPYGLEPGMVFQAQALFESKPVAGAMVEVEHYNARPPKSLPPDEFRTRVVKTDPNGVLSCTLTDPGWWCITAYRDGGTMKHEGKEYPLRLRTTLWVYVDEKK